MVVIFEQTDGELRKLRVLMRVKLAVSRIEYKLLFGAARSQNLTTVLLPLIHRRRLPPPKWHSSYSNSGFFLRGLPSKED